jgi:hypothetical protein
MAYWHAVATTNEQTNKMVAGGPGEDYMEIERI